MLACHACHAQTRARNDLNCFSHYTVVLQALQHHGYLIRHELCHPNSADVSPLSSKRRTRKRRTRKRRRTRNLPVHRPRQLQSCVPGLATEHSALGGVWVMKTLSLSLASCLQCPVSSVQCPVSSVQAPVCCRRVPPNPWRFSSRIFMEYGTTGGGIGSSSKTNQSKSFASRQIWGRTVTKNPGGEVRARVAAMAY
jgi:hypothetical protein